MLGGWRRYTPPVHVGALHMCSAPESSLRKIAFCYKTASNRYWNIIIIGMR